MDETHFVLEWWHIGLAAVTLMLAWIARLMDHWRKFVHGTIRNEIQPIIDKIGSIDNSVTQVDAQVKKLQESVMQSRLYMERRVTQIESRCSAYHEGTGWKHVRDDHTD